MLHTLIFQLIFNENKSKKNELFHIINLYAIEIKSAGRNVLIKQTYVLKRTPVVRFIYYLQILILNYNFRNYTTKTLI